jgi:hypothetical protein
MAKGEKPGPGWEWRDGRWNPPSIGPVPSGDEEKSPVQKNQQSVAEGQRALAETLGMSPEEFTALFGDEEMIEGEDPLEAALSQAALEVSGIDLFTYGPDARVPHWVPPVLRPYVREQDSPLQGVYDPYHGFLQGEEDDRVFMGIKEHKPKTPKGGMTADGLTPSEARAAGLDHNEYPKKRRRDDVMSLMQAQNLPYAWDDDEVAENMRKFRKAGVNVTDFDGLKNAWSALVDRASKMYVLSQGEKKVTPWDVLELHKKERRDAGVFTDFEDGSRTVKYTSVTDISEGASWEVLRTTLSALLGRDPSDQELRDYSYRMNTLAAKNPSITESITRYKAGEVVSEDRTTTGGFDSADMAKEAYEQAQNDPEYAKVQGGTTLFNALIQALGAVGDV